VRDERTFWRRVVRAYELLPRELPELQARLAAKYCRNLDLWKVLPALRRDHRLFLVYSGPSTTLACWRGAYRLDETFDAIVSGVEEGLTARDPALYRVLAARAGVAPEACAVVESTQAGVEAAEAAGLPAYRYGSAYGLLRWLRGQEQRAAEEDSAPGERR